MVGPSTLGVLNNDASVRLRGTFAGAPVPAGRLAISSQSGAIGIALLGDAAARRLGLSSFASLGGRADVSTNDLLEYWDHVAAHKVARRILNGVARRAERFAIQARVRRLDRRLTAGCNAGGGNIAR